MTDFNSLPIGSTFDFIGPEPRYNSFFERCLKISRGKYRSTVSGVEYRVGSRSAEVFHIVTPMPRDAAPLPFAAARGKGARGNVVQGSDVVATCRSYTFAVRVANALNEYQPKRKAV